MKYQKRKGYFFAFQNNNNKRPERHKKKEKEKSNNHRSPHDFTSFHPSILSALASRIRPPRQPIRNIAHIASRGARRSTQVTIEGLDAAVVAAGGGVSVVVVVEVVDEAVAVRRALDAVLDHVPDRLVGVVRVELDAAVRLHDAWVLHAAGGGGCFYFGAAVGLFGGRIVSGGLFCVGVEGFWGLTSCRMVARMKRWSTRETFARYWMAS
jgi:hypothetical protein